MIETLRARARKKGGLTLKVTLKQIAEMAGVHRSTVDKVLHKREGVSDEVRRNVQAIIDELDYQPNAIGKALALQRNPKTIAVILLRVDALKEIRAGIESAYEDLRNFGFQVDYYITREDDPQEQLKFLQMLKKKKIHGLLLMAIDDPEIREAVEYFIEKEIPVITLNTDLKGSNRICFVGQNSYQAGRAAGDLFGQVLGSKGKVAEITSSEKMLCSVERQDGFESVIKERYPNLEIVDIVETHEEPVTAYQKTLNLMSRHRDLDGIYITSGNVSEICRAIRMVNPEKPLKIISFDLYPEIIQLVNSGVITFTIGQNLHDQGFKSLKTMFDLVFSSIEPPAPFINTAIDIRMRENINL